jgi:putative DNA primase/helicase
MPWPRSASRPPRDARRHAPIDKTDWSPLAGKTVIIWPDNDAPGFEYAKAVSARLTSLGCTVLGVTPPSDAPTKWDAADCVAEGRDAHAIIAAGQGSHEPQAKPRVRLVSISQLANSRRPTFLIDGTITVNGLSMLWGRSGSLKSFAALDQGLCVATGLPWHGRTVKQGRVVYLAAEGASGLASRAMGWMSTRGRDCPSRISRSSRTAWRSPHRTIWMP